MFIKHSLRVFLVFFCTILLSGCLSKNYLPKAPKNSPSIAQAQQSNVENVDVRWGGTVLNVINEENQTYIEVLAKRLRSSGLPFSEGKSTGRFMALSSNFIDPHDVSKGDYISVYGSIERYLQKDINAYQYKYPVVLIEQFKTWPKNHYNRPYRYSRYPYWHGGIYQSFYYGGHRRYRGIYRHGFNRGFHGGFHGY